MGNRLQDTYHFIAIIIGIFTILSLLYGFFSWVYPNIAPPKSQSPSPTSTTVASDISVATTTPTSSSTPMPTPTQVPTGLSLQEVQSWCTEVRAGSEACSRSNFSQLQEANGTINPNGVHFKANAPAKFDIKIEGISIDIWDCFKTSQAISPVVLPQVCEASFRKG